MSTRRPATAGMALILSMLAACGGGADAPVTEAAAPPLQPVPAAPVAVAGTQQTAQPPLQPPQAPAAPPVAPAAPAPLPVGPEPVASPPAAVVPELQLKGAGRLECLWREQSHAPGARGVAETRAVSSVVFEYPGAVVSGEVVLLSTGWPGDRMPAQAVSVEPVSRYAARAQLREDGASVFFAASPVGRSEVVVAPGGRVASVSVLDGRSSGVSSLECR